MSLIEAKVNENKTEIMYSVRQPSVQSVIENESKAEQYWVEGRKYPESGSEVDENMRLARDEINCVAPKIPFPPEKATVVLTSGMRAHGAASPVDCGRYRVVKDHDERISWWEVERTPERYVLFLDVTYDRSAVEKRETVRHELAHMAGWETEGVTYEQRDNHAEWLDRLGAGR